MRKFAIMIATAVLITLGFAGVVYAKGPFASTEMDVPCTLNGNLLDVNYTSGELSNNGTDSSEGPSDSCWR